MSVKITKKDNGYGNLMKRLRASESKHQITVGIHEKEGSAFHDDEVTVADVAAINEFGGPKNNPPQRSWLRAWSDKNKATNEKVIKTLMEGVIKGTVPSKLIAAQRFGEYAVREVKQNIRSGIAPENEASTIKQKGSSTPLIDEGIFWGSITYQVDKK